MPNVAVRCAVFVVVLAVIIATAAQPAYAAPARQTAARVLCVNGSGGATGAPCTNADAYSTIQAAVDAAQSGDEIRIAKGVYTSTYTGIASPEQYSVVVIGGKSLKLVGGFAADNWTTPNEANKTIIDGQDQVRGITAWDGKVVLEYLTMTHGKAPAIYPSNYSCSSNLSCGGAIYGYNSNVSLTKVVVSDNHAASHGGGIGAVTVAITDTQIINNRADGGGGGIDAYEVKMLRSTVDGNSAHGVGGLYALGGGVSAWNFSAIDSVITQNTAMHAGGVSAGKIVIERTRIEHNTAVLGGGLFLEGTSTIVNSVISDNRASEQGGGLYGAPGIIDIGGTVFNNNVAGVAGDAIYINKALMLLRNVTIGTMERAPHAAIHVTSDRSFWLFDTVITNHAVGIEVASTAVLDGDYNAFFNNGTDYIVDGVAQPLPFANLVTADPRFVNPAVGDFHLQPSSPLIDRGDPKRDFAFLPRRDDPRDIDGEAVPYGGRADIGADEWVGTYHTWAPLVAR